MQCCRTEQAFAVNRTRANRVLLPGKIAVGGLAFPASSQHGVRRWTVAGCRKHQAAAVFPETHGEENLGGGRTHRILRVYAFPLFIRIENDS